MSTDDLPTPDRRRRQITFSLRALFLLTLLVAMVLGWYRREVDRVRIEKTATEKLAQLGVAVQFYDGPRFRPVFAEQVTVIYDGDEVAEVLPYLHGIRKLWRLHLDGSSVTDNDLREIARLHGLERLSLRSTAVTDAGVEHLVRLRSLDSLDLAHTRVTNQVLDSVRRLRLHSLDVTGTHVTEDEATIDELVSEWGSAYAGPARSEKQRQAAARLEQQGAHVSILQIEGQGQVVHVSVSTLIHPGGWKGNSSDLACLLQLPNLRCLSISGVVLDDTAIANMRPVVEELRSLYLNKVSLVAPQLTQMLGTGSSSDSAVGQSLSKLESLAVRNLPLTDEGTRALKSLANLRRLDLSSTSITDTGLVHLSGLAHLEELTLDGTNVRGEGLRHLQHLKELTRLALFRTPITDASLPGLKKLSQLKVLGIESTAITPAGADELRRALPDTNVVYP